MYSDQERQQQILAAMDYLTRTCVVEFAHQAVVLLADYFVATSIINERDWNDLGPTVAAWAMAQTDNLLCARAVSH